VQLWDNAEHLCNEELHNLFFGGRVSYTRIVGLGRIFSTDEGKKRRLQNVCWNTRAHWADFRVGRNMILSRNRVTVDEFLVDDSINCTL
jgi:hypothetical protein